MVEAPNWVTVPKSPFFHVEMYLLFERINMGVNEHHRLHC